jgi:predicted Fe-Mo cluster-binding NifX family protein
MKIAISATQPNLDCEIDPRFGRCQYFVIVEMDTMAVEEIRNTNIETSSGAGISTAQMIVDKDVQVVITGNVGPKAAQVLESAGVQIVTGVNGSVRAALEAFQSGNTPETSAASSKMAPGTGRGMGSGRGMGRGMGSGRGMGGCGRGMGMGMGRQISPQSSVEQGDDISALRNRAEMLSQELKNIQQKLKEFEKK